MTDHLLVILQRLTGDGEPLLDEKLGLAERQGVAFQRRGAMGSQIPNPGQYGTLQVWV
ncbi:MAG: hypothetical protein K9L32_07835 [Chromatiaceae bacterium]|nr:hypothetical protein [Chromatiaceae bacterium]MCF8004102.1 hypothetical protein [Chromatiaceae bacterium]